jgi:hypothetical protein
MDTALSTITVRHVPDDHRYELLDGETVIGAARYVPYTDSSGPQRIFFHTEVDERYAGRGLGARLATFALRDTVDAGTQVVPVCPYLRAVLGRHPELAADAVPVRPEHLGALRAD